MVYLKYIRKNNIIEYSDGSTAGFTIEHDKFGYYTTLYERPFNILGINKVALSRKVLGYYDDGCFPYCRTEKDVFKLLRGLQKESKIKYYMDNEL